MRGMPDLFFKAAVMADFQRGRAQRARTAWTAVGTLVFTRVYHSAREKIKSYFGWWDSQSGQQSGITDKLLGMEMSFNPAFLRDRRESLPGQGMRCPSVINPATVIPEITKLLPEEQGNFNPAACQ